jgi:hypothetical protein
LNAVSVGVAGVAAGAGVGVGRWAVAGRASRRAQSTKRVMKFLGEVSIRGGSRDADPLRG